MSINPWILSIIKQINTKARNDLKNNLKKYDITDTQLEVLVFLNRNRELKINQRNLEGELHLSNPTIVSLIDRLEEKGLAVRNVCKNDRRQKYINITEQGIRMCEDLYDDFCREEMVLLNGIPENERIILEKLLKKVLNNVSCNREEEND